MSDTVRIDVLGHRCNLVLRGRRYTVLTMTKGLSKACGYWLPDGHRTPEGDDTIRKVLAIAKGLLDTHGLDTLEVTWRDRDGQDYTMANVCQVHSICPEAH